MDLRNYRNAFQGDEWMIVVGVDPGQNFGWAVIREGIVIASGVEDFHINRGDSPGMRYIKCEGFFSALLDTYRDMKGKTIVIYEQAHQRGGAPTEYAFGFITTMQKVCALMSIQHTTVHTATVKKWATGYGKASKEQMIIEAEKRVGKKIQMDDEADAILISLYGFEKLGNELK